MSVGHEAERWDQRGQEEIKSTLSSPLPFLSYIPLPHLSSLSFYWNYYITLPQSDH